MCSGDTDCVQAEGGRCEASGACSFPDPECPTGRRYGSEGNPQVADKCVPVDDVGSTGLPADDTTPTTLETNSATGTTTGASSESGSSTGEGSGSTGVASSSSGEGGSSSSTGADVPVRELYQPCTMETQAMDCPNSACVEIFIGNGGGGFCSTYCNDASDCYDPGTGASVDCLVTTVEGTDGGSCVLECSESGATGCVEGMSCSPTAMFPDGTEARVCYHPA